MLIYKTFHNCFPTLCCFFISKLKKNNEWKKNVCCKCKNTQNAKHVFKPQSIMKLNNLSKHLKHGYGNYFLSISSAVRLTPAQRLNREQDNLVRKTGHTEILWGHSWSLGEVENLKNTLQSMELKKAWRLTRLEDYPACNSSTSALRWKLPD